MSGLRYRVMLVQDLFHPLQKYHEGDDSILILELVPDHLTYGTFGVDLHGPGLTVSLGVILAFSRNYPPR